MYSIYIVPFLARSFSHLFCYIFRYGAVEKISLWFNVVIFVIGFVIMVPKNLRPSPTLELDGDFREHRSSNVVPPSNDVSF